jgi:hypothetical protein
MVNNKVISSQFRSQGSNGRVLTVVTRIRCRRNTLDEDIIEEEEYVVARIWNKNVFWMFLA